ncbi:30S ribosomal protein S6 [Clostridia bacterium]|nr:30S ribosomal protein S6 [Clostridia bacterium]
MNKYELALVFKPQADELIKEEFEKITALITRFGGTVDKIDEWGKRRLAYEIKKHNDGVYYFVTFIAEPDAPKELESRLRIVESILRYLITVVEE